MAKLFHFSAPKAVIGAAVMASMAMSAVPASAQSRDYQRDGISAGEVIAGVVVLGGLAAILSSGNDRDGRYDNDRYRNDARYGYGYDTGRYGDSRAAVNQCARAVEQDARRYGNVKVTQVTKIDRKRDGYQLRGEVVANQGRDRNWNNRDRGNRWNGRDRYDTGKFSCEVKYGRVQNVKVSGLRR
jgi:hypothetical protein